MVFHRQFSKYKELDVNSTNFVNVHIRRLISTEIALNFIMDYIEIEPNGQITDYNTSSVNEIYIIQGDCKAVINQENHTFITDDFVYLPPNTEISLMNRTASSFHFLRVYPTRKSENYPQEIIHYPVGQIPKKNVTNFGSTNTSIQVFLDQDDNFEYIMRKFTLLPNAIIGLHNHPWEHEIFILQGKICLIDGKGNRESVSSNEFVYIPPNVPHGYLNQASEPNLFICMIPNMNKK